MFREYLPLRWSTLRSVTGVRVAPVGPPARLTLDSPALSVTTDFSQTFAEIEAASGIDLWKRLTLGPDESYTRSIH